VSDGHICPPECKVELEYIKDNITKCELVRKELWEALDMKVNQKLFLWMAGIAVVVLLAVFGAIYRQGGVTLEKVQAAQVEQAKMQETLKNHTENSEKIKKWIHERERTP